jgi:hypothetical protein
VPAAAPSPDRSARGLRDGIGGHAVELSGGAVLARTALMGADVADPSRCYMLMRMGGPVVGGRRAPQRAGGRGDGIVEAEKSGALRRDGIRDLPRGGALRATHDRPPMLPKLDDPGVELGEPARDLYRPPR